MSLPVPNLDDKTWTQIVEEARLRIPRRSKDWTDWNVHDPGISFIELFAWLAEMQRFRLNRVSAATNRRFFKLISLEAGALQPARVWVSFGTWQPGIRTWFLLPVSLPVGSPLMNLGAESLDFEVARDTFVHANLLRRVTTDTGKRRLDQTEANDSPEIAYSAFGDDAPLGTTLELEFEHEFEAPEFEIYVDLFEDDLSTPGKHGEEAPAPQASVDLVWEYRAGDDWRELPVLEDETIRFLKSGAIRFETPATLGPGRAFQVRSRLTAGRFEIPPRVRAVLLNVVELVQVKTVINELLGQGNGLPDQTFRLANDNVLNTALPRRRFQVGDVLDWDALLEKFSSAAPGPVAARLLRSFPAELLQDITTASGAAQPPDGADRERLRYAIAKAIDQALADPSFLDRPPDPQTAAIPACDAAGSDASSITTRAANRDVLSRELPGVLISQRPEIEVGRARNAGGIEWQPWQAVNDFFRTAPKDRHYVLDSDKGEIRFGNGFNGVAPARGDFVRARVYWHTRGARGNIPPGQRWGLSLSGLELRGTSPRSGSEGNDRETISDTRARAEQLLYNQSRAVTTSDLGALACNTPGVRVARTMTLPNRHPGFPGVTAPGNVTVVVVPEVRRGQRRPPIPGEGFLRTVRAHMERHRLLTTTVHVIAPIIERFSLSVLVVLARRSSESEVRKRLERDLVRFFDPLTGGSAPGLPGCRGSGGWPFGRPIYPSEIYERIDLDPGVDYATHIRLQRLEADGTARPLEIDQALELQPHGLPDFSWEQSQVVMVPHGDRPPDAADPCAEPCGSGGVG